MQRAGGSAGHGSVRREYNCSEEQGGVCVWGRSEQGRVVQIEGMSAVEVEGPPEGKEPHDSRALGGQGRK